jgi:hypothetical protein
MRSYSLSGYVQLLANGYVRLFAQMPRAGDHDPYLLDLMDWANVFSRNAIRTNRKRAHTSQ